MKMSMELQQEVMRHTPTPWEIDATTDKVQLIAPWSSANRPGESETFGDYRGALVAEFPFVGTDGAVPTEAQARTNAEHVRRAVHNHDALVAALRFQQDALHDLCGDVPLMMSLPPSLHARIANMRDDVDAALAAAQE